MEEPALGEVALVFEPALARGAVELEVGSSETVALELGLPEGRDEDELDASSAAELAFTLAGGIGFDELLAASSAELEADLGLEDGAAELELPEGVGVACDPEFRADVLVSDSDDAVDLAGAGVASVTPELFEPAPSTATRLLPTSPVGTGGSSDPEDRSSLLRATYTPPVISPTMGAAGAHSLALVIQVDPWSISHKSVWAPLLHP